MKQLKLGIKVLTKLQSIFFIVIIVMLPYRLCFANNHLPTWTCTYNPKLQFARSQELQKLVNADQSDRQNWNNMSEDEMVKMAKNDVKRRKRVGEIFGEGCFKESKDYLAAALIYQHGNTSDHYYQAYIWSKRAVDLGGLDGKPLSALNIDRYLVSIGKKQLFGSQYFKLSPSPCFCMQPVEKSFPDSFRKEYLGRSLEENYTLMASMNAASCPKIECNTPLQPTPKSSVIGLW